MNINPVNILMYELKGFFFKWKSLVNLEPKSKKNLMFCIIFGSLGFYGPYSMIVRLWNSCSRSKKYKKQDEILIPCNVNKCNFFITDIK